MARAAVGLVCQTVSDDSVMVANICPPLAILMSTMSCDFNCVVFVGDESGYVDRPAPLLGSCGSVSCCDVPAEVDRPSLETEGLELGEGRLCFEAAYVFGAPMGQYMS